MLDEPAFVDELEESCAGGEVVFDAVFFLAARGAGGVGDAEAEALRVVFEEAGEEGGFACAAGAGDDDGAEGF